MVVVSDAVVLIGDNRLDSITAPAYLQLAYIIGKRLYPRILAGILVGKLVYENRILYNLGNGGNALKMLLVLVVMLQYFPDTAATVTAGQGYLGVCILVRIFTPQVLAVFQGILLVLFQIIPRYNLITCYFHRSGIIQFFYACGLFPISEPCLEGSGSDLYPLPFIQICGLSVRSLHITSCRLAARYDILFFICENIFRCIFHQLNYRLVRQYDLSGKKNLFTYLLQIKLK